MAFPSPVEDFAGPLGKADLAAVLERLEPDPGRLAVPGVDMGDVGDVQHRLLLDDAAGLADRRPGMALDHVDALDQDAAVLGQDAQHLAALSLVLAGDDHDLVALLDLELDHLALPHRTSGASDTIFMNLRARSSRV